MTDLTPYRPAAEVAVTDPTGGRLVAWAEAASAANALARSLCQTAFVPKGMTDAGNATAAILMGDELGLSPIAALRSIYVVHGTPAMYARTMVALVQSRGHEVWTEETSPAKVAVCGRRRGSDHVERATWTPDRARKAGYTSNAKYGTNPEEMLYAKAAAEVCRKIAADVLAGVPHSVEDIELEQPAVTATVTRDATARRTVARALKPEPDEPDLDPPTPPGAESPSPDVEVVGAVATAPPPHPEVRSEAQSRAMHAAFRDAGLTERDDALGFASEVLGRVVATTKDLTRAEASAVIDALKAITAPDRPDAALGVTS